VPESPESSNDISQIRRDLRRLNEKIDGVSREVKEVGRKVDKVEHKTEEGNAARLAALATSLSDAEASRELLMSENGMSHSEIAKALGVPEPTVRQRVSRARRRRARGRKRKPKSDG
jgi:DNA-directed RNA polymerase specialized sigma24 family protein